MSKLHIHQDPDGTISECSTNSDGPSLDSGAAKQLDAKLIAVSREDSSQVTSDGCDAIERVGEAALDAVVMMEEAPFLSLILRDLVLRGDRSVASATTEIRENCEIIQRLRDRLHRELCAVSKLIVAGRVCAGKGDLVIVDDIRYASWHEAACGRLTQYLQDAAGVEFNPVEFSWKPGPTEQMRAEIKLESARAVLQATGIGRPTSPDEMLGFLPASALATEFGLDLEATEKKLARFRAKHQSSDYWIENADVSTRNTPRYFYNVARVRDTLLKKRPSNVPQEKSSRGKPQ